MSELPTGTVTFLFTDIEGSTNLARTLGERWPEVLEEHHQILRKAIRGHRGMEVRTEGDSFFAVFASATDAVAASATGQRRLADHAWPPDRAIRVRMGMHTGEGRLAGDDYVGIDIHRAARIAAAGHGGQVLLSEATRGLVADKLPDGVTLRDLGEHRLKDFEEPQPIYQLVADGLPSEFPPIRTLAVPTNLPASLTAFVGRQRELAQLADLLERNRLLTLVGPGGTGKTRLLVRLGADNASGYPDGVYFVDLAPIQAPELVPSSIAQALRLKEGPARSAIDAVIGHLRDRTTLLLLDNFEQVIDAGSLVERILRAAPKLSVAVTSRIRLGLMGEQEFPVPPLGVPDPTAGVEALAESEAVALFVDRARAVRPSFDLTLENAAAIAEICVRMDGLPLALELAAAQLRVLGPGELLDRLKRGFPLRTGAANVPQRQRTLRDAIQWSYERLGEAERRLFARSSVFLGGGSLEAIEEVGDPRGDLGRDAIEVLASLVDQSLVRRADLDEGSRFSMLEPIREYAGELLEAEFDLAETEERHAVFFARFVEQWGPAVRSGEAQIARSLVTREHDNVRAVVRWAVRSDRPDVGLAVAAAMWPFWVEQSHLAEGVSSIRSLLGVPSASAWTAARAAALVALGALVYWQADYAGAVRAYEEAVGIYRELEDTAKTAQTLKDMAFAFLAQRDAEAALPLIEECLQIARERGDLAGLVAEGTGLLGIARAQRGDLEGALEALEDSLRKFEGTEAGAFWVGEAKGRIGAVYRLMNRLDEADRYLEPALRWFRKLGATLGAAANMKLMADVAFRRGDHKRAVHLIAFSEAVDDRMGGGPPKELMLVAIGGDQIRAAAAEQVDHETVERWWAEGSAMDVDEAIAYALGENT